MEGLATQCTKADTNNTRQTERGNSRDSHGLLQGSRNSAEVQ